MNTNKIQINFFYGILLVVLAISFFIFLPFFKILFLSAVLTIVFYPLYRKLSSRMIFKGGESLSAVLMILLILLIILIPFVGLSILIFREISAVYSNLVSVTTPGSVAAFVSQTVDYINGILPFNIIPDISADTVRNLANQGYGWILDHFQSLFSSAFRIAIDIFLIIFALFFFFRDGKKFKEILVSISPLVDKYDNSIIKKIGLAVNSVVKGSLLIAVAQGMLAALGFFIFGVPAAVLWGAVTIIAAIIPSIGTGLIIFPAVVYLFFAEGVVPAVGLLIWGIIVVGLIDNVMRPLLLEREIKIHPFLILLSVLGALALFGPIGFLAGPIILSLLFALIDIYPMVTSSPTDSSRS